MTKDEALKQALAESIIHLKAINAVLEALAQQDAETNLQAVSDFGQLQEQEPVAFHSRRAVERAIESVENPKGMHLNDGKERVILPGGTLRYMLALIDHTSPPQRQPLTHEQRIDLLIEFEPSKSNWNAESILIDMVEAKHGIGDKT